MDGRLRGALAAFAAGVVVASQFLTATGAPATANQYTGTLHVRAEMHPDHMGVQYLLEQRNGTELTLTAPHSVAEELRTLAEREVTITGTRNASTLTARSVRPTLAAMAQPAVGPRAWKLAVFVVNYTNDRSTPYAIATIRDSVFTGSRSAARYWTESTGGQVSITGDVFGVYQLPISNTACDMSETMTQAKLKATANGVNLATYDHFQVWLPDTNNCGGWAGLGELGGPHTWIKSPPGWGSDLYWAWSSHELGHNLNLNHSSTLNCGGVPLKLTGCTHDEYGDPFDTMGAAWLGGHLTTNVHKSELGVANPLVTSTPGTYTLSPASPVNAALTQALQIPQSGGGSLWLEYRRPYGAFDNFSPADPAFQGVFVRTVEPDAGGRLISHLLDMSPDGNFMDAALQAGRSFTDPNPGGLTITVNSVSGAGASITLSPPPMTAAVDLSVLRVTAAPGVDDAVTVTRRASTGKYTVASTSGMIAPGAGCLAVTASKVSCSGAIRAVVTTGGGNDTITVTSSQPVKILGGGGNDTITAPGSGAATIHGGAGADTIRGGTGKDSLIGNHGADTIAANDGIADEVLCKAGADRVTADRTDVLTECETITF